MKGFFLILMFFIFSLDSTEVIGVYQIKSKYSFDSLEIKKDGTYKYKSRGDSCWTWRDINGKWETKNDTLILYHDYSYKQSIKKEQYLFSIKNRRLRSIKFPYVNEISTYKKQ
jgi:hypothetical protein